MRRNPLQGHKRSGCGYAEGGWAHCSFSRAPGKRQEAVAILTERIWCKDLLIGFWRMKRHFCEALYSEALQRRQEAALSPGVEGNRGERSGLFSFRSLERGPSEFMVRTPRCGPWSAGAGDSEGSRVAGFPGVGKTDCRQDSAAPAGPRRHFLGWGGEAGAPRMRTGNPQLGTRPSSLQQPRQRPLVPPVGHT